VHARAGDEGGVRRACWLADARLTPLARARRDAATLCCRSTPQKMTGRITLRALLTLACLSLPEPAAAGGVRGLLRAEEVKLSGEPPPTKQTAFQRQFMTTIQTEAEVDSQAAEAAVLAYLDSAGFRRNITECCPTMAKLPAPEILARLTEELRAAEVVRNFNIAQDWTSEVNMSTWLKSKYDYNLWEMVFLGLHKMALSDYLPGCDQQEVDIMGFPPFKGVPRGAIPRSFAEAADRPIYTAVNLWKVSTGNQEFGPISFVFAPDYVKPMQFIVPMDSGIMRGECNESNKTTYGHKGANCDAWPHSKKRRNLGVFDHFNNILASWLRPDGLLQPTAEETMFCASKG
jgi:hypothetical protein